MARRIDYSELCASLPLQQEADGEVSLSVEATNALREKLGLKALNASESSEAQASRLTAERNYELARAADQEARRLGEIEAELARAKRRREARKVEIRKDEVVVKNDAKAWAEAHQQQVAKLEAERRAKLFADQESEVPQTKISAAAFNALGAGEDKILTLRDEPILQYEERRLIGLNHSEDIAEDYEAAEARRRAKKQRILNQEALDARAGGYDASDDKEFLFGTTNLNEMKEKAADRYQAEGGLAEAYRTSGWGKTRADVFERQSEYLTADEASKLFRKKKKKSKKKIPLTSHIIETTENEKEHRISRAEALARRQERAAEESEEKNQGSRRFREAQARHQEKVDAGLHGTLRLEPLKKYAKRRRPLFDEDDDDKDLPPDEGSHTKRKFVSGLDDGNDDAELRAAIDRARNLNKTQEKAQSFLHVHNLSPKIKKEKPLSTGLVFTSTTEFTTRLHSRLEDSMTRQEDSANATNEKVATSPEEKLDDQVSIKPEDDLDFIQSQPLATDGLAGALSLFKASGDLQEIKRPREIQIGRARDERDMLDDNDLEDKGLLDPVTGLRPVKLEYRDKEGRLLTRREAFRQLCHKFHGKAPGKKKTEKYIAAIKEEQRSHKSGGLGSMSVLQHFQQNTGQAYVAMQGGRHSSN